jgi:hypothetical protein
MHLIHYVYCYWREHNVHGIVQNDEGRACKRPDKHALPLLQQCVGCHVRASQGDSAL